MGEALYRLYAGYTGQEPATSKVIWDLAPVAWLLKGEWFESERISAPTVGENEPYTWDRQPDRHPIRVCTRVNRDCVFRDLARRVSECSPHTQD